MVGTNGRASVSRLIFLHLVHLEIHVSCAPIIQCWSVYANVHACLAQVTGVGTAMPHGVVKSGLRLPWT